MDQDIERWKETIPKHWEVKLLGDICNTTSGGTPNRRNDKYYEGNIPWVKSGELNRGLILDTEEKISEEGLKNSSAKIFPKGTLLIALYGATIGKLAFLGIDAATNQAICGIFRNENIELNYLYYFLFYEKRFLIKQAFGGAQPNISQTILKNLQIPLPPLAEQQTIVAKIEELFSELEKGKEQLETALAQLKVYRQSLLQAAFSGKLTNPDVKEGELPDGWKWVKSGELFSFVTSGSRGWAKYYSNKGAIFIRITNLNFDTLELDLSENKIQYVNPPSNSEGQRTKVNEGDFLFSITGYLGMFAIAPKLENAYVNQHVSLCRPKDNFVKKYLGFWIISKSGGHHYLNKNQKGAVKAGLNLDDLKNFPVPLCTISEQEQIVQILESKLTVCDKIEETIKHSLAQADVLRQSILKQAFEGKLAPHIQKEIRNVATEKVDTTDQEKTKITFNDIQMVAFVLSQAEKNEIQLAEMTLAKYLYLLQTIYKIQLNLKFKRWHLGPYAPEIKKIINNRTYFKLDKNAIKILNKDKLTKYNFNDKEEVERSMNSLAKIFSYYSVKDRSRKTELLATLCRVIEEIKSMDFESVRKSMQDWPIELDSSNFKNKAQKFSEDETKKCLAFIQKQGWDQILLTQ